MLSPGKLAAEHGIKFVWCPRDGVYFEKPDGKRVPCSVAVDVPYVAAHVGVAKAKASPPTGHATSSAIVAADSAAAPAPPVAPIPPVVTLEKQRADELVRRARRREAQRQAVVTGAIRSNCNHPSAKRVKTAGPSAQTKRERKEVFTSSS